MIEDAEAIKEENDKVKQLSAQIWPGFDAEIPKSVQKMRLKRKRRSSVADSGIPDQEKGDLFVMITTNCKWRKPIKELYARTKELKHQVEEYDKKYAPLKAQLAKREKPQQYIAVKGDAIDKMFADAINRSAYGALRIVRLEQGKYMFGTKKIMAKIINGKLVIRVGGGYMCVDEFIAQYGRMELMKAIAEEEKEHGHTFAGTGEVDVMEEHDGRTEHHHHIDQVGARDSLRRVQQKTDALLQKQGTALGK
jgi:hypothetical protein